MDASKSGFGSTVDKGDNNITMRIGVWNSEAEEESSNWREFENLVETVESEANAGNLHSSIIILATDNQVTESCIYKGNSSSEKLFDLIVRLRTLELKHNAKLFVTHVSGKRMIQQGTDGISRGQRYQGVSIGETMSSFCPWGESALDRSPNLLE